MTCVYCKTLPGCVEAGAFKEELDRHICVSFDDVENPLLVQARLYTLKIAGTMYGSSALLETVQGGNRMATKEKASYTKDELLEMCNAGKKGENVFVLKRIILANLNSNTPMVYNGAPLTKKTVVDGDTLGIDECVEIILAAQGGSTPEPTAVKRVAKKGPPPDEPEAKAPVKETEAPVKVIRKDETGGPSASEVIEKITKKISKMETDISDRFDEISQTLNGLAPLLLPTFNLVNGCNCKTIEEAAEFAKKNLGE